jgi:hypothetical protein
MPIMPGAPMAIPGCMGMPFAIIMPGCMPMGAGTMPAKDAGTSPSVLNHHNMCFAHPHSTAPHGCNPAICHLCKKAWQQGG